MEITETTAIVYEMDDGSPAYDERAADRAHICRGAVVAVTLTRYEGRWIDVDPNEVTGDTLLWRDVDTWLKHNPAMGEVTA